MKEGSSILFKSEDQRTLWRQFQLGNENALATIYSLYFDHLYNYGFRFTSDSSLVEDCIQELFIKLMRNRNNLAVPDSVKNYLFKAFRSSMFDKLEKSRRYNTMEISESFEFGLEPHREMEIIRGEEDVIRQRKLGDALNSLTPRQREAVFLKFDEGFSYPALAEMLGLTQKAAYKLVARAIQSLRTATSTSDLSPQKKI